MPSVLNSIAGETIAFAKTPEWSWHFFQSIVALSYNCNFGMIFSLSFEKNDINKFLFLDVPFELLVLSLSVLAKVFVPYSFL